MLCIYSVVYQFLYQIILLMNNKKTHLTYQLKSDSNKLNGNYYDLNSDSCGVTQFMQQKDKLVISGVTKNTNKGYMDDCC